MKSTEYTYNLTIKEHHLDTFGHVNNATYLALFEEARWEIIEQNGFGLSKIMQSGLGPTILEVKIKYKRELKNREPISIRTTAQPYRGKIGVIQQQMINSKGEVCCEAEFTFGLFDLSKRKLVAPTKDWLKAKIQFQEHSCALLK